MPSERFFTLFSVDEPEILLTGKEFHHLSHVMRLAVGDVLEIVNGKGAIAQGVIKRLDKKEALIKTTSLFQEKETFPRLILAQAFPRLALLEWVIEKGTELNATEFWLFPGEKSEKKEINPAQMLRLEALILAALKQCGRLFLPKIVLKPPLKEWQKSSYSLLFGDLDPQAPSLLKMGKKKKEICFVIGPEKGLSVKEIEALHKLGAKGIKLHANTLRTETAAVAALSQMFLIS